ncbi:leucine-rich repeat receptor-like protein kinase family protein [Striga asiatica]|uniref:Leucine-rich repeat receptor-like protein kinase family protein n=1 Tax=Striga asiatica TaxID=4170 RepID=A0A5A7PS65_STRAF|nr:leucine-rich repeat receptor-like protein kinase family protein [Striga asiatica]
MPDIRRDYRDRANYGLAFLEIHSILDEAQILSVKKVLKSLVEGNAIGKGCSGVAYRVELKNGKVKKFDRHDACRHSGPSGLNHNTRLLMYDYMANESLTWLPGVERDAAYPVTKMSEEDWE